MSKQRSSYQTPAEDALLGVAVLSFTEKACILSLVVSLDDTLIVLDFCLYRYPQESRLLASDRENRAKAGVMTWKEEEKRCDSPAP